MHVLALLILGMGLLPLLQALRRCRWQSLRPALAWALLAWLAWMILLVVAPNGSIEGNRTGRYLALCLTGCAGVAVLGARRPGVTAWNFVVLGLLAVMLLFWAEGLLTGTAIQLGGIRLAFLVGTLLVGFMNYVTTRLGPAAVLLANGCLLELLAVGSGSVESDFDLPVMGVILGLVPWLAWAGLKWQKPSGSPVDQLWLDFRNHYGLVWGKRLEEQFNRSAANSGLPVELRWHGLEPTGPTPVATEVQSASLATLQALLKRFGLPDEHEA